MSQMSQTRRMITAFFDDRSEASRAVDALRNAGISDSAIRMIEGDSSSSTSTASSTYEDKGFFAMLGDLFMPADDRDTYAEGLSRGGYVVSVETRDGEEDTVVDILDVEGSVDLDTRSSEWESSGWSRPSSSDYSTGSAAGMSAGTGALSGGMAGMTSTGVHTGQFAEDHTSGEAEGIVPVTGGTGSSYAPDTTIRTDSLSGGRDTDVQGGDKIQVAAEEIRVGKRDVNLGRVRVRSYVVETPVEESVSLRSERVDIHRTPVDRPVTGADDLFRERSIEMEERAQEAVVSKDARIVEEIEIGKTAEERTETIRDTVRHTEVEIDDQRTTGASLRGGVTTDRTSTTGAYDDDRTLMDSIKGGLGLDDDTVRGGSSSR